MDREALTAAAELCRLAGAPDLLSWLSLPAGTAAEVAQAALVRERKRMQSMQGNPKYREQARHLLKTWRRLEVLLADPKAYLDAVEEDQRSAQLPFLERAIDGVLADRLLTTEEEAFLREQAVKLGIGLARYERLLHERCAALGVAVPTVRAPAPPPPVFATVGPDTSRIDLGSPAPDHAAEGAGWWDDTFTRVLLAHVPVDVTRTIDLACGLGFAALVLLRERPKMEYLGIDPDPVHVKVARRNVEQASLGSRAVIQAAEFDRLPLPDGVLDLALCIMSLQELTDTRPVFREAARLVRPGGRMIAVEADTTSQQFWYDGPLRGFNELFQELCARVDAQARAASTTDDPLGQSGFALGPELGRRMAAVGLRPQTTVVHPVQVDQQCRFPMFARKLRRRVDAMATAAGLEANDPLVARATAEVDRLEKAADPHRIGSAVHLLPLFLVVGVR